MILKLNFKKRPYSRLLWQQIQCSDALAGIETVFFVCVLLLTVASFVISLARLTYAKTIVDDASFNASRFESITLSQDLPLSITRVNALGSKVSLTTTVPPKPCSYVTVIARTTIALLPIPFFTSATSLTVSGSSTLPTNAYQVSQTYGFNC